MKNRIAFISTMEGYSWGGSEELWSQAAMRLRQQGHTVGANVKAWPEPAEQVKSLARAGCDVKQRKPASRLRRLFRLDKTLEHWIAKFRPDLVVISDGLNHHSSQLMQACIERSIAFVTIAQSASETAWPQDDMVTQSAKAYEQAKATFFVSQANLDLTKKQYVHPFDNAVVVRNPFTVSYNAAPPWPSSSPAWKLACVGRLAPSAKGQDILFEVLSDSKWKKRDLTITLYGNGPSKLALQSLANMYGLENVVFGGFVHGIEAVWASHHALILPSRMEGLPLAVVEAMLCGRTCIVTDVAGNPEVIEDNASGFLASCPNTYSLDEAMERAWSRRTEWQAIGQVAATRVRHLIPSDPVGTFVDQLVQWL